MAVGLACFIWLSLIPIGIVFAARLKCEGVVRRFCFACLCTVPIFWASGFMCSNYIQLAGGSARFSKDGRQFTLVSHGAVTRVSEATWRRVLFLEAFRDSCYLLMTVSLSIVVFVPRFLGKPSTSIAQIKPSVEEGGTGSE